MDVLAYDLYPNEEFQRIYNIHYVGLDELYAKSDVITLHAPATKENYHLLNDEAFKKMKDGVIILNTARGSLVGPRSPLPRADPRQSERGRVGRTGKRRFYYS